MKCPHCKKEVFGKSHNVSDLYEEPIKNEAEPEPTDCASKTEEAQNTLMKWLMSDHTGEKVTVAEMHEVSKLIGRLAAELDYQSKIGAEQFEAQRVEIEQLQAELKAKNAENKRQIDLLALAKEEMDAQAAKNKRLKEEIVRLETQMFPNELEQEVLDATKKPEPQ